MGREYKNAAEALAADIAGDGAFDDTTLFAAGWAGTISIEKLSNGLCLVVVYATTIGTITDGTTIATLPAGYRPTFTQRGVLTSTGGTDGAAGFISITAAGIVQCYDVPAALANLKTPTLVYMARS